MPCILYHQNGIQPEYVDNMLANNWNPCQDYGNEYVRVYFRINAPFYQYPFNNISKEARAAFYSEVLSVFSALQWNIPSHICTDSCPEVKQGVENLYLHPQQFSGIVLKNNIRCIADALSNCKTFKLAWVDLYETVYDITPEQYYTYLMGKLPEIHRHLFETFKTLRTNKYKQGYAVAQTVAKKVGLSCIKDLDNFAVNFVTDEIIKMTSLYLLVRVIKNDCAYYRSINKTEQKKLKIDIEKVLK